MSLEYNTERTDVRLKEYGRNIQKLVSHIKTIEDKAQRSAYAQTLTDLMRQINPDLRGTQDYEQKIWDDLFNISQFEFDVEAPFPMPEKEALGKKPQRVPYKNSKIKYLHYGRNVEIMIEQAIAMEDPKTKEEAVIHIGRLMKGFYNVWNKDNIDDEIILKQIRELSNNQLDIDIEKVKEHGLFNNIIKPTKRYSNTNNKRKGPFKRRKR